MKRIYSLAVASLSFSAVILFYTIGFHSSQLEKATFALLAKAQASGSVVSQQEPQPGILYPNRIDGQIQPSDSINSWEEVSPSLSNDATTNAIAAPATTVATFNTTITRRPFKVRIYDNATQDGDIVRVIFNGRVINSSLVLTSAGQTFEFSSQQGLNGVLIGLRLQQ